MNTLLISDWNNKSVSVGVTRKTRWGEVQLGVDGKLDGPDRIRTGDLVISAFVVTDISHAL